MYTIKFFFTDNASYKATNVVDITTDRENGIFTYVQEVSNADGTIVGQNLRRVDMSDLLYAVVKELADGELTVISSVYDQFEIVPVGKKVTRQQNIEAEAAKVNAHRESKAFERATKEEEKYIARRAARKAQYVNSESEHVAEETAPVPPSVPTRRAVTPTAPETAPTVTVSDELYAAGLDANSIATLKNLDILK